MPINFSSPELKLPKLPQMNLPVGFFPLLHYRDLSLSCPPHQHQIKSHEESLKIFVKFVFDLQAIKNFPSSNLLHQTLANCFHFSETNTESCIFLRLALFTKVTSEYLQDVNDKLQAEFFPKFIQQEIREHVNYSPFLGHIVSFTEKALIAFLMPYDVIYSCINKHLASFWEVIQRISNSVHDIPDEKYPKTNNVTYSKLPRQFLIFWSLNVAVEIARIAMICLSRANIFIDEDVPIYMLTMRALFEVKNFALIKLRESNAIYSLHMKRQKKKRYGIIKSTEITAEAGNATLEENYYKGLATYFMVAFIWRVYALSLEFFRRNKVNILILDHFISKEFGLSAKCLI